ncbi:MAG: hypothetical protein GQ574_01325 [Crocinitomix sp.]|nr:hypothetical protein [Crocinitomix sp.]
MTNQKTETTIHTRLITDAEKTKMRRAHWMLLPAILIPAFIIWVLTLSDEIPNAAKYAAYTIGIGVFIVIAAKQYKLEKELSDGEAEVIRGVLEDKYKFGGNKMTGNSGVGTSRGKKNSSQPTYILVFSGKKYWVQPKIYKQAEEGANSEMVWLPTSQYVISINKI